MSKSNDSTTLDSAVTDEFRAVKKIMDTMTANWPKLAPDTKVWLKSRLETLPTDKVAKSDVDQERV
jgi:hypothetical protein